MNQYNVATTIRLSAHFSVGGADTDPSTIKLHVRDPLDVVTEYEYGVDAEVVKDATGKYHADLDFDQSGIWGYHWYGSGSAKASDGEQIEILPSEA